MIVHTISAAPFIQRIYDSNVIYETTLNAKPMDDSNEIDIKYKNYYIVQSSFIQSLKKNGLITLYGQQIDFNSTIWDFSKQKVDGKPLSIYHIHFNPTGKDRNEHFLSEEYNIMVRLYAMDLLLNKGVHSSLIVRELPIIRSLLTTMEDNGIYHIEDITINILSDYLSSKSMLYTTQYKNRTIIYKFMMLYSIVTNQPLSFELLDFLKERDNNIIKAHIENNKTPLLPSAFYCDLTNLLFRKINDSQVSLLKRGIYGLLYLDTQIGIRSNELCLLTDDALQTYDDFEAHYQTIKYRITKTVRSKDVYTTAETIATETVKEVFMLLNKMFKSYREEAKSNLLVINPETLKEIQPSELSSQLRLLCINHAKELNIVNLTEKERKQFSGLQTKSKRKYLNFLTEWKKAGLTDSDTVSYPTLKQFRVYVSTEFHKHGLSDEVIAKMLGHTTTLMYSYYTRETHPIQEDIDFSKELLKEIISDDLTILGSKGQDFKYKINEMIQEDDLNVEKDLDAIIEKVCNEMPIRAKHCGFCVKSSPGRKCRHDAKTDEFMCAYNCCPNHCHLYYMVPIAYEKCKNHYKILNYNIESRFINAAQKEGHVFATTIANELEPELDELEKMISYGKYEDICQKHPEISYYAAMEKQIRKEIKSWKKLINETNMMTTQN